MIEHEHTIERTYLNHTIEVEMSELNYGGVWMLCRKIEGPIVDDKYSIIAPTKSKTIEPDCGIINKDLSFSKALEEIDKALGEAMEKIESEVDREMKQDYLDEMDKESDA